MQQTLETRRVPPRWLYWLAAALYLGVPLALAAVAVPTAISFFEDMQSHGHRLSTPGQAGFRLETPGEYALYLGASSDQPQAYSEGGVLSLQLPDSGSVTMRLVDAQGSPVPLRETGMNTTVSIGSEHWVCIGYFNAASAGEYVLHGRPADGVGQMGRKLPLLVAESGWPFGEILGLVMTFMPILFGVVLCVVGGVGLAMFVYVRRYDARTPRACNM